MRGVFRTLKRCVGDRTDKVILVDHPLVAWLLERTRLVFDVVAQGDDGTTPWHRARGRPFRQPWIGFGESILYRSPRKAPRHAPEGNTAPLQDGGIFLGLHRSSNSYIVCTKEGRCIYARAVTRRAEQERWNPQALTDVRKMPGDHRGRP